MKASAVSVIVFILVFGFWCSNVLAQPTSKSDGAASHVKSQAPVTRRVTKPSKYNQQLSLIQGIWTTSPDENAVFTIKGNRVIFLDSGKDPDNKNITFTIKDNKMSINYGNGLVVTDRIIKLNKDSLVTTTQDGGIRRLGRMK